VYDNEKNENPAKAIFYRFPFPDETFPVASQKNVFDSIVDFDNSPEAKEKLVKTVIDSMVENMMNNRFDHVRFVRECVDHFEDFIYGDKDIATVDDFLTLPPEAVQKIAKDLYAFSKTEDVFSMGE
jgi:hypothetical protein